MASDCAVEPNKARAPSSPARPNHLSGKLMQGSKFKFDYGCEKYIYFNFISMTYVYLYMCLCVSLHISVSVFVFVSVFIFLFVIVWDGEWCCEFTAFQGNMFMDRPPL